MFLLTKAVTSVKDLSGTNYAQIFKILIYYRDISRTRMTSMHLTITFFSETMLVLVLSVLLTISLANYSSSGYFSSN